MLKHKQTKWFILANLVIVSIYFVDLLSVTWEGWEYLHQTSIPVKKTTSFTVIKFSANLSIYIAALVFILTIALVIAKRYTLQIMLASIALVMSILFLPIVYWSVGVATFLNALNHVTILDYSYKIGFYLPILSSIFLVFAIITTWKERRKLLTSNPQTGLH